MNVQRTIDFGRAEQLGLVRDVPLSKTATTTGAVSPAVLRGVLRVLDDHGRGRECFVSFDTLARESGYSTRTAKRAVVALEQLGFVCVTTRASKYGTVCNHYQIVWSELAVASGRAKRPASNPEQSDTVPEQSDTVPEQSDTVPEQSDTVTPKPPTLRLSAPPTVGTVAASWDDVERELARLGIADRRGIAAAMRSRLPDAVAGLAAVREAAAVLAVPANRGRLSSPIGAAAWYLRTGQWPGVELVDPVAASARAAKRAAVELTNYVMAGRVAGVGAAELKTLAMRRFGHQIVREHWAAAVKIATTADPATVAQTAARLGATPEQVAAFISRETIAAERVDDARACY